MKLAEITHQDVYALEDLVLHVSSGPHCDRDGQFVALAEKTPQPNRLLKFLMARGWCEDVTLVCAMERQTRVFRVSVNCERPETITVRMFPWM